MKINISNTKDGLEISIPVTNVETWGDIRQILAKEIKVDESKIALFRIDEDGDASKLKDKFVVEKYTSSESEGICADIGSSKIFYILSSDNYQKLEELNNIEYNCWNRNNEKFWLRKTGDFLYKFFELNHRNVAKVREVNYMKNGSKCSIFWTRFNYQEKLSEYIKSNGTKELFSIVRDVIQGYKFLITNCVRPYMREAFIGCESDSKQVQLIPDYKNFVKDYNIGEDIIRLMTSVLGKETNYFNNLFLLVHYFVNSTSESKYDYGESFRHFTLDVCRDVKWNKSRYELVNPEDSYIKKFLCCISKIVTNKNEWEEERLRSMKYYGNYPTQLISYLIETFESNTIASIKVSHLMDKYQVESLQTAVKLNLNDALFDEEKLKSKFNVANIPFDFYLYCSSLIFVQPLLQDLADLN